MAVDIVPDCGLVGSAAVAPLAVLFAAAAAAAFLSVVGVEVFVGLCQQN